MLGLRHNRMSFPSKAFEGVVYEFDHLAPLATTIVLPVTGQDPVTLPIQVHFGCHCFTEGFKPGLHQDHHRYTYKEELRAFDLVRYTCSLQLPNVVKSMIAAGRVYASQNSYTYVAQMTLKGLHGPQNYSVFFSLERDTRSPQPALRMFVKSGYLKALAAPAHAASWRFTALAGQVGGVYPLPTPKPRPLKQAKKKGP